MGTPVPASKWIENFGISPYTCYIMKPTDKQKKTAPAAPKPKAKAGDKTSGSEPSKFSAIAFNVIGAVVSILILSTLFKHNEQSQGGPTSGYDWLLNSMLKNNLETIDQNPDKTTQQKYEMKWGPGEILYVEQIKKIVPDTATVMLPPVKLFKEVGYVMTQTGPVVQRADQPNCKAFSMVDIPWITYFLYPRKVIYADSVTSPLTSRANYLVSIGGWGLDQVGYTVEKPEAFMVLPIKK